MSCVILKWTSQNHNKPHIIPGYVLDLYGDMKLREYISYIPYTRVTSPGLTQPQITPSATTPGIGSICSWSPLAFRILAVFFMTWVIMVIWAAPIFSGNALVFLVQVLELVQCKSCPKTKIDLRWPENQPCFRMFQVVIQSCGRVYVEIVVQGVLHMNIHEFGGLTSDETRYTPPARSWWNLDEFQQPHSNSQCRSAS